MLRTPPRRTPASDLHRSRAVDQFANWTHRLLAGTAVLFLLAASAVAGFVTPVANAASSTSYTTSAAACAGIDPGAYVGACITKPNRSQTWLGSYKDSANGQVFICIDYLYSSQLAANTTTTSAGLTNKFGTKIPDTSVRALSYADSKYAPNGSSGDPITDAALAYVARVVMGDGYVSQTPLAISATLPDTSWGLPPAIFAKAQQIWDEARTSFGPYVITLTGLPTATRVGQNYAATATLTSSPQVAGGAHPLVGYLLSVTASGGLQLVSPAAGTAVVTNATGQVPISLKGIKAGTATVTASATGLPGVYANIEVPMGWQANAAPDTIPQRGLTTTPPGPNTPGSTITATQSTTLTEPPVVKPKPKPTPKPKPGTRHNVTPPAHHPALDGDGDYDNDLTDNPPPVTQRLDGDGDYDNDLTDNLAVARSGYHAPAHRTVHVRIGGLSPVAWRRVWNAIRADLRSFGLQAAQTAPTALRDQSKTGAKNTAAEEAKACKENIVPASLVGCALDAIDGAGRGVNGLEGALKAITGGTKTPFWLRLLPKDDPVRRALQVKLNANGVTTVENLSRGSSFLGRFGRLVEKPWFKIGTGAAAALLFGISLWSDRRRGRGWIDAIGHSGLSAVAGWTVGGFAGAFVGSALAGLTIAGAAFPPLLVAIAAGAAAVAVGYGAAQLGGWVWDNTYPGISRSVRAASRAIGHAAVAVTHWAGHQLTSLGRGMAHAFTGVVHTVRRVTRWVGRTVSNGWHAMQHFASTAKRAIGRGLRAVGHAVSHVIFRIGHNLSMLFNQMPFANRIGGTISGVVHAVGHAVGGAVHAVGHAISSIGRGARNLASSAWNAATSWL